MIYSIPVTIAQNSNFAQSYEDDYISATITGSTLTVTGLTSNSDIITLAIKEGNGNKVTTISMLTLEPHYSITTGSTTKYYETFALANAAANSGEIIKQIADYTDSSLVTIDKKNITFDNNGKTLNKTGTGITVNSESSLEIKGEGIIIGESEFNAVISNNGNLQISNGTIQGSIRGIIAYEESSTNILNGTIVENIVGIETISGNSSINISGGIITGESVGIWLAENQNSMGAINITGGKIEGTNYEGIVNYSDKKINIEGNTIIIGNTKGIFNSVGTLEVSSGTIIGKNDYGIVNSGSGIVTIGTQSDDLSLTKPTIIGKTYGVNINNGTFYFYNGIIKGVTAAYDKEPNNRRQNSEIIKSSESIEGVTYKTAYLEVALKFTKSYLDSGNTTLSNGATISVTTNNSVNGTTYPGLSITGRPTRNWTDPDTPNTMIRWYKSIDFDGFNYLEFYVKKGENHGSYRVYIDNVLLGHQSYQSLSTDWTKVSLDVSEYTGNHILSLVGGYTDYSGNATSNTLYCNIKLKT